MCAYWVQAQVSCTTTGVGRFADPSDTTCKNYTLCVRSATNGTYFSYNYVCPTTSLFNPSSQQCSTNYTCGTTTSTTACPSAGRYPFTSDTTCQTYYLCVLASNGTFSTYNYTCPSTSLFSPTLRRCTTNYTCNASG